MNNPIEKLVPCLENCRKIPENLLRPTVFVWKRTDQQKWKVVRKDQTTPDDDTWPAPTFEELYRAILNNEEVENAELDCFSGFSISVTLYENIHDLQGFVEVREESPKTFPPVRFMGNPEGKDMFEGNEKGGNIAEIALQAWLYVNDLLPYLKKPKPKKK